MQAKSSKSSITNPYSQSWVYESTNNQNEQTSYLKISQNGTPQVFKKLDMDIDTTTGTTFQDKAHLIDNPVVHIEEASDDSTSNSDRKLCHMKSFSPSASPLVLSASSSQLSLNQTHQPIPIYECLEKLTNPIIYRQRLNSTLSNKSDHEPHYHNPQTVMIRRTTPSPKLEKVQYASLMKELQKAIVSKKEPSPVSPPSKSDSVTSKSSSRHESSRSAKSSDAEFSKELEAALQLIQDLESPNTIDTPSEPKSSLDGKDIQQPLTVWKDKRTDSDNNSEKTLSPSDSITELTSPILECQPELYTFKPSSSSTAGQQGKNMELIIVNSASTSGYCSPNQKSANHTPNWSTTSSISDIGNNDQSSKTYTIHNTKSTAVISLYSQDASHKNLKSVSLVTITGNNDTISKIKEPIHSSTFIEADNNKKSKNENDNDDDVDDIDNNNNANSSSGSSNANSNIKAISYVKSLLRKKKNIPKLRPELEDAIVKSECLAYLSENELVARHQRNNIMLRVRLQFNQRAIYY